MDITFSNQQKHILNIDFENFLLDYNPEIHISSVPIIAIPALAGTGKSFTILQYAKKYKHLSFLFIALNDSIIKDLEKMAKDLGIKNCKFYTMHKYALSNSQDFINGRPIQNKFSNTELADILSIDSFLSVMVSKMFSDYCKQELNLDEYLLAEKYKHILQNVKGIRKQKNIIDKFKELVSKLNDLPFVTHDMYLKHFVDKSKTINEDILVVDESQDLNAIMLQFIFTQLKNNSLKGLISVGDNNQSIYGFINSIDIISKLSERKYRTIIAPLTHSFRFEKNSNMERYANSFLAVKHERIIGAAYYEDMSIRDEGFIARTNAQILEKAISFIKANKKYNLVGGTKVFDIELISDIWNLANGNFSKIKSDFLKDYESKEELKAFALEHNLVEYISAINFVEKMFVYIKDEHILSIIEASGIQEYLNFPRKLLALVAAFNDKKSNVYLSTFHKSKGLGMDRITILGRQNKNEDNSYAPIIPYGFGLNMSRNGKKLVPDLFILENKRCFPIHLDNQTLLYDEYNLMYVATTRAKKEMIVFDDRLTSSGLFATLAFNLYVAHTNGENPFIYDIYNSGVKYAIVEVETRAGIIDYLLVNFDDVEQFIYQIQNRIAK